MDTCVNGLTNAQLVTVQVASPAHPRYRAYASLRQVFDKLAQDERASVSNAAALSAIPKT